MLNIAISYKGNQDSKLESDLKSLVKSYSGELINSFENNRPRDGFFTSAGRIDDNDQCDRLEKDLINLSRNRNIEIIIDKDYR